MALQSLQAWLSASPDERLTALAQVCAALARTAPLGLDLALPGPTGERNIWTLLPRDAILGIAADDADRLFQLAHILAAGSRAVWPDSERTRRLHARLPRDVQSHLRIAIDVHAASFDFVLVHGDPALVREWSRLLARRKGPIVALQACANGERTLGALALERLMVERMLSVNTTAAGGNASLMTIA
jgi:RHH-type proline utilization regulon transcriptional repressor/proline dehydrogenase/delta 1-pyrroline-5-carboxylate dehydrogenase